MFYTRGLGRGGGGNDGVLTLPHTAETLVSQLGLDLSWKPTNTARFPSPPSPLTMPAGVPWTSYVKMVAASLLAMFAGAEVVHRYYRPDLVSAEWPSLLGLAPLHSPRSSKSDLKVRSTSALGLQTL